MPKVLRTKNRRIMLLSKCEVRDSRNSKFIKLQEASGLISSLGINTPLNEISLSSPCFKGIQWMKYLTSFY